MPSSLPPDAEITRLPGSKDRPKHPPRRRRRKRKKGLAVPAPLIFYVTAPLVVLCTVLVYIKGAPFLGFSVGACIFTLLVLIINERYGFARSKRMRRSNESRVNFTDMESMVLFLLLMVSAFVSLMVWVE